MIWLPCKPFSNLFVEKLSKRQYLNWETSYSFPRTTTYNTYMHSFLYKSVINVLLLDEKLFFPTLSASSLLCSIFGSIDKTPVKRNSIKVAIIAFVCF